MEEGRIVLILILILKLVDTLMDPIVHNSHKGIFLYRLNDHLTSNVIFNKFG